jgi:hypothetical protein
MKAKLILKRYNDCYALNDYREPSKGYPLVIAHSGDENFRYKLSKQNCDEIFGVVDVEKIADRHTFGQRNHEWKAYIKGFSKALELNKDKVFTLEDIEFAIKCAKEGDSAETIIKALDLSRHLEGEPTEMDVEIEMEWITAKTFCDTCNKVMYPDYRCEDKTCFSWQPKLDSLGCLILKKI